MDKKFSLFIVAWLASLLLFMVVWDYCKMEHRIYEFRKKHNINMDSYNNTKDYELKKCGHLFNNINCSDCANFRYR